MILKGVEEFYINVPLFIGIF